MDLTDYQIKSRIMDAGTVKQKTIDIANAIRQANGVGSSMGIVGIRTRGEYLASRIHALLERDAATSIPIGYLDVSFYRDDTRAKLRQPVVQSSHIPFDVNDRSIILIDDVLYTGRSVRAAIDELMDFGRPSSVRLAVLVDRGMRELPIQPDFVGMTVNTSQGQQVRVRLEEVDGVDEVLLLEKNRNQESKA